MNNLKVLGTLALITFLLGGCAANDLVVKRQTETETKVEYLYQNVDSVATRLNDFSGRLAHLEDQEKQHTQIIQGLNGQISELREANQALQVRLQEVAGAVTPTPKIEVINPGSPVKGKDSGPPQTYVKAFGLYSSNAFSSAIQAFELFLKENPTSDYVPNAHYWIGECYYSSSDLPKAQTAFQKVVNGWPRHPKASDALLKIGYSFAAQNQHEKAKESFERLIRIYPGSQATVKARERLMSSDQPAFPALK